MKRFRIHKKNHRYFLSQRTWYVFDNNEKIICVMLSLTIFGLLFWLNKDFNPWGWCEGYGGFENEEDLFDAALKIKEKEKRIKEKGSTHYYFD